MTTPTQNGTPPPTTNGTAQTATPAPAVQSQSEADAYKAKLADAEKREVRLKKDLVVERAQWSREKQTFGEKLKSADEYDKLRKTASVDKLAAAKALLGENFLEELNTQAANGTISPAQLQRNLAEVREETLREVDERAKRNEAAQAANATKAEQAARSHLTDEAAYFYEQAAADYPLLEALGDKVRVGEVLASHVNGPMFVRFRQALAAGDADARVKLYRELATNVENMMVDIADRAASNAKYQPRLREKLTPPKTAGSVAPSSQQPSPQQQTSQQPGRRSLNNDIATGSTPPPEEQKYETDDERRRRLVEKYAPAILKRS